MFNKLNFKILIAILVVLLGIILLSEQLGNKESSFNNELIVVDTAAVTAINIRITDKNADIKLFRNNTNNWRVKEGNNEEYQADYRVIQSVLGQLVDMKPERIAATSKEKWNTYELSDSSAIAVTISEGSKKLPTLYVGKFSFQPQQNQMQGGRQPQGKMTSYIRVANDKKVYAINGFLKMAFQPDANSYRMKTVLRLNKDDITHLNFQTPLGKFELSKTGNRWISNGQAIDSVGIVNYLNSIANLTSNGFAEADVSTNNNPDFSLLLEGNNFSPLEVKAFATGDTTIRYFITSSANQEAVFDGSKNKLFDTLFEQAIGLLSVGAAK